MSRDRYQTDLAMKDYYRDKSILVTGGTGSIGRKIVEELLSFSPEKIIVFSKDESKQYFMKRKFNLKKLHFILGDMREYSSVEYATRNIDIVFHVAALKHVSMCEENPYEAVKTNIIGAQNLIDACIVNQVKKVINISTDKAVNPTNTMGATKLITEKLFKQANKKLNNDNSMFCSVRFGNVLGSRGSVIPLLLEQLKENRPLTITDPDMTRFFMSISDAVKLTLKAGVYSNGGETFILKMKALRLKDLVSAIKELAADRGLNPIKIVNIGIQPGEKLYEELIYEHEMNNVYEKEEFYIIQPASLTHLTKASINSYRSDNRSFYEKDDLKKIIIDLGLA
ncbi:capsule biosynthesis protein CapD [Bacillus cereus]|nr:capsule biosynthesis protein CapD [Bacillus cereus]